MFIVRKVTEKFLTLQAFSSFSSACMRLVQYWEPWSPVGPHRGGGVCVQCYVNAVRIINFFLAKIPILYPHSQKNAGIIFYGNSTLREIPNVR